MIQKLVDPQDFEQLSYLNNIAQEIRKVLLDVEDIDFADWMQTIPEHVVRFFDSAIQILLYIYNDEYIEKEDPIISFTSVKKEISDTLDELEFLRHFLGIVGNRLIAHDGVVRNLFISAQEIPAMLSFLFCSCFEALVDDKKHVTKISSRFKIGLPRVREHINTHVKELYENHRSRKLPVRFDMDSPAKIIDEEVVDFFDGLIDKLRKEHISWDNNVAPRFMVTHVKDQLETAIDELSFLRCNLLDILKVYSQEHSAVKEMESLSFSTLALIIETAYKIYCSRPHGKEEDATERANYWSYRLSDLIEAVDSLKLQASDLFNSNKLFSLSSRRPRSSTNHIESVNFLIKNLEELIDCKAASVASLKHQIETFYQEVVLMRKFLVSEIANSQMANSQMEYVMERFEEVAYQSSSIIDSFLAGKGSLWYHRLGMFVVANEVKMSYKEIKASLKEMEVSDTNVHSISSSLASLMTENPPMDINAAISSKDEMEITKSIEKGTHINLVGVKDAAPEVIELLTKGATKLKIVSVVGMPGLGKTTLANSVYEHPSISMHFHVRAWCCVSQVCDRETLLADIFSQVVGKTNPSLGEVSGNDLAQKLYQNLKGRRYLIVIDDIWDIKVWYDLETTFPNDDSGSRILFTTQHRDVALKANSLHYNLRPLSNKESCELLWFKVFGQDTCPPEFSISSKRIARNCQGLPLAVVLVASILRTERRKASWEQVAATVKSLPHKHGNHWEVKRFTNILELSYKHLPVHLKQCFLYIGALLNGSSINVSKLIRLWISEGFVPKENLYPKSLEQEAKCYLNELIDRSLVMIARRSSTGGVKACRIHNVLQDFCSGKFQKRRYMMRRYEILGTSCLLGDNEKRICSILYNCRSNGGTDEEVFTDTFVGGGIFSLRALFLDKPPGRITLSENVMKICHQSNLSRWFDDDSVGQYEFLRVLDMGNVRVESSADTSDLIMISTLVHLKYLAIRPRKNKIPSKIGNLQSLETFILTGAIGHIRLPESLLHLVNLRNVLVDHGYIDFGFHSFKFAQNLSPLDNLKSLSTIPLKHGNDVEFILSKLPSLQKLGCKFFSDSWDESTGCNVFPELGFLSELESLKVFFSGKVLCPCNFSFPTNLKKLSMSNSRLPWKEISVIGRQLPNLEVLKLLSKAFEGPQWDMGDDEFQKLKFLKLDSLDIKVWNAYAEQFPCLEQLVVLSCPQLEEIPSSFGEISTLQSIEMKWCSSSAMDSLSPILQGQHDFSNDQFKVTLIGSA